MSSVLTITTFLFRREWGRGGGLIKNFNLQPGWLIREEGGGGVIGAFTVYVIACCFLFLIFAIFILSIK